MSDQDMRTTVRVDTVSDTAGITKAEQALTRAEERVRRLQLAADRAAKSDATNAAKIEQANKRLAQAEEALGQRRRKLDDAREASQDRRAQGERRIALEERKAEDAKADRRRKLDQDDRKAQEAKADRQRRQDHAEQKTADERADRQKKLDQNQQRIDAGADKEARVRRNKEDQAIRRREAALGRHRQQEIALAADQQKFANQAKRHTALLGSRGRIEKALGLQSVRIYAEQSAAAGRDFRAKLDGLKQLGALNDRQRAEERAVYRQRAADIRAEFGLRNSLIRAEQRAFDRNVRGSIQDGKRGFGLATRGVKGIVDTGAIVAAITGGIAAAVSRSVVRASKELDTEATTAAIHIYSEDAPKVALDKAWNRRGAAIPEGINLGLRPSTYLGGQTEASQAGIPEPELKQVNELGAKYAKLMGLDLKETMDDAGHAIYALRGNGYVKGPDGIRKFFNMTAGLAGQTAASRRQMMSFARSGLGAGMQMGMTPEGVLAFGAAATSAGVQGRQSGRMLNTMATDMAEWTVEEKDVRRKQHKSAEDKLFLQAPQLLGYGGGFRGMARAQQANPDDFLFDMIGRFKRIQDPTKRMQVKKALMGKEFGQFFGTLVESDTLNKDALKLARKLSGQNAQTDYLTTSWAKWTTSMEFFLDQIDATWEALKDEMGEAFKPFIEDFRNYFVDVQGSFGNLKSNVQAGLKGLIQGLGGKDGSLSDLLRKWFGDPGKAAFDPSRIQAFFRGFGEGIKSVVDSIASLASALGGPSDPERLGRWTAEFLGWTVALKAAEPFISTFKNIVETIAGVFLLFRGGQKAVDAARRASGAGSGKMPGENAGGEGAGAPKGSTPNGPGGPKAGGGSVLFGGAAILSLPIDPSKADQDRLMGRLGAYAQDQLRQNPLPPEVDPRNAPKSIDAINRRIEELRQQIAPNTKAIEDNTRAQVQKQSYSGSGSIGGQIHNASLGSSDVQSMGARLQLAALTSTGALVTGTIRDQILGGSVSGGGGGGGSGGGGSYVPGGGGAGLSGNVPGQSFSIPGVSSRYGVGGDGIVGGSTAPGGGAAKTFAQKAPGIMDRLQRDLGLTRVQAAAVLGNLGHESDGFTAFAEDKGRGPGRGWAQWTDPGRKARFFDYAKNNGLDPKSDEASYGFLKWELQNTHKNALSNLKRQTEVGPATIQFEKDFEGAAANAKHYDRRIGYAQQALGGASVGGTGSSGAAVAADNAARLLGAGSAQAASALGSKMTPGEWCADFVNGALKSAGIKGVNSSIANSFLGWGKQVMGDVQKGDVLVEHRGRGAGQPGGHAGLATGRTRRSSDGRLQYEMVSGNHGNRVASSWVDADRVAARRSLDQAVAAAVKPSAEAAAKEAGSPIKDAVEGFKSSGWWKDGYGRTDGGPWKNKRTGEEASPAKQAELNRKFDAAQERMRKFTGGTKLGPDGQPIPYYPYQSEGWKRPDGTSTMADKAKEILGGKPGTFTGKDEDKGFSGSGWKKAEAADLASQSPAERLASQAPSRPGGGGGGRGGNSTHAPITIINNGDAEHTANQVQRRIQDTQNYRSHDLSYESV